MKIENFPVGRENKKTRKELMESTNITNEKQFKKELAELKQNNIILCVDNGYYIPNTKEELQNFIEKCNKQNYVTVRIINLAYKKLEDMEE